MKLDHIIIIVLSLSVLSPVIVFFHELGHAITGVLFTKGKVDVYFGSYANKDKSFSIKLGLFKFWFVKEFKLWNKGLCDLENNNMSIAQNFVYIVMGPLFPVLVSLSQLLLLETTSEANYWAIFSYLFFILSIFDFFRNLIPKKTEILLADGRFTHNDGFQLVNLFSYRKYPKEFNKSLVFYKMKKFKECGEILDKFINEGYHYEDIYRINIHSKIELKEYEKALELINFFIENYEPNTNDYCNIGLVYSRLNEVDKAIEFYNKSLELEKSNIYSLNNLGYQLNELTRYEEAIPFFDKVISINPNFAFSYNNRGYSKVKLGDLNEGLKDINKSLELDKTNSYVYRNLGIYFLELDNYKRALELFEKSKSMDEKTDLIDDLINEVKAKMSE